MMRPTVPLGISSHARRCWASSQWRRLASPSTRRTRRRSWRRCARSPGSWARRRDTSTGSPPYDPDTKRVEWGTRLRGDDGRIIVNYTVRLLGRRGVMHATLVSDFERAGNRARHDFKQHDVPASGRARLVPFAAPRFEAVKWEGSWTRDGNEWRAHRVFLTVAPGWLAQLTLATDGSNVIYQRIAETLGTTSQPACYWPMVRARYPDLPGALNTA